MIKKYTQFLHKTVSSWLDFANILKFKMILKTSVNTRELRNFKVKL